SNNLSLLALTRIYDAILIFSTIWTLHISASFLARRYCIFSSFSHSEFHHSLRRNLYLLFGLWIYSNSSLALRFYKFTDTWKDKRTFLFGFTDSKIRDLL